MLNINLRYIKEEYNPDGTIKDYSFTYPESFNFAYDIIDEIANYDPQKKAMIWCNTKGEERTFTYADLKILSNKTANMLIAKGVRKGDMVMVVLKRHWQFWPTILALHKLGAIIIPATFMLKPPDVIYRCNSAKVKYIICTGEGDTARSIDEALSQCPTVEGRIMANGQRNGWDNFEAGVEAASSELVRIDTKAHEPMIMYFSSGTTGNPKMAIHPHTYALAHLTTAKYWHKVHSDSLHFTIADTGWGKAVWGKLYGQMMMEACVFTYDFDKFSGEDILEKLEKYKITSLCCPPTMFRMFLLEDIKKYDLSSLEYCTIAGEALQPEVFNKWKELTGIPLMEGFGQTETTVTIANLFGMEAKPGSMGKPVPHYDIDIIDEDGNSVVKGQTGEIVIRTDKGIPLGLFTEYYAEPERTKEVWSNDIYHTGDTAWQDEDGYLWYVGRTDDVIKASGYRIGPFEIESVLATHPAVLESAVTGVPDPTRGNIVKATIVLKKGYCACDELKQTLQEYVKKETAPYKYPRIIDFVDELPKTVNGKIRRAQIRQQDSE